MNKGEIGGLVALVTAAAVAAAVLTRLEIRVKEIADRQKSILEGKEESPAVHPETVVREGSEGDCAWQTYVSRVELENTEYCPDGSYVKGVGFRHPFGHDLAYQMDYRLYCCALQE